MAADRLVVSDLLCYLVYKFGKMPLKELKAVLLDSYEADAIAEARLLLLKDVEAFKADLKLLRDAAKKKILGYRLVS